MSCVISIYTKSFSSKNKAKKAKGFTLFFLSVSSCFVATAAKFVGTVVYSEILKERKRER